MISGVIGRLGVADHHDAAATALNVFDALSQVVQEGRASADGRTGRAEAAEHVRIDEVGRHLAQTERQLFRRDAFAHQRGLHHAAAAVRIELAHRAARVHGELVGLHGLAQHVPVDAQASAPRRRRRRSSARARADGCATDTTGRDRSRSAPGRPTSPSSVRMSSIRPWNLPGIVIVTSLSPRIADLPLGRHPVG